MQNLVRKWRGIASFYFHATATAPLFFALAPPRPTPPFPVRASGAVALKVAQVHSTDYFVTKVNNATILLMMLSHFHIVKILAGGGGAATA